MQTFITSEYAQTRHVISNHLFLQIKYWILQIAMSDILVDRNHRHTYMINSLKNATEIIFHYQYTTQCTKSFIMTCEPLYQIFSFDAIWKVPQIRVWLNLRENLKL